MTPEILQSLKYPIGNVKFPLRYDANKVSDQIHEIACLPQRLRDAVSPLSDEQLNTPYRPEGWTIRQVVHHLSDSHMNSFIRFKWTLTEDTPVIKAYDEQKWAEREDAKDEAIEASLLLLTALHLKWSNLITNLTEKELHREFVHPDTKKKTALFQAVAMYAWHSNHHLAHITKLIEKNNW